MIMYQLQKVDFQNIRLHDRPGGWLAGEFLFDMDQYAEEEELEDFLVENPRVMLDMATNLFYYRELGLSMTKMFYIFEKAKQNQKMISYMNTIFERISSWYEVDEEGTRYLLIQGEGISEACMRAFEKLKRKGCLNPVIRRLYVDSRFQDDMTGSGYYSLEKDSMEEEYDESCGWVRSLFEYSDFRHYGSINVSGLSMEELKREPILKELLELTDQVYLYVFDLCLKNSGEKVKRYVKILRWNVEQKS